MPLWAQVSADIRRRCAAGAFTDGVPGEMALSDEYAVSRHTIREALRELRAEGLISSERGRGSVVRTTGFAQSLGTVYSLFRTIEEHGAVQTSDVLSLGVATDPVAASHLDLPHDAALVVLERIRRADGEPLAIDRTWLPHTLAHPLLDADFTHTALYEELARRVGIHVDAGHEHMTALIPDSRIAGLLGVEQAAVLFIQRLGTSDGRPVEWRETWIRGDRFSVETRWTSGTAPTITVHGSPQEGTNTP